MRRWLKNTLIVIGCLIPVGFVIGFSNNWSHKTTITSVGSSGVKPFIEDLAKEYLKTNKSIDITVDAGGSGFGVEQVAKGFANIGNASKNPYSSVTDPKAELQDQWINRKIKTYTVAWEAICLVYIPPKGVTKGLLPGDGAPLLSVSDSTISKLYQAFSGFADGDDYSSTYPKLSDFINTQDKEYEYVKKYQDILSNTKLIPYVRTGGSLTSGTAASFYDYSRFTDAHKDLDPRTENAFAVGNYGSDWTLVQTDEANSRAWDMFAKSNIPGSVVYLSSGFIAQNYQLIKDKGYGIFGYQKGDSVNPYSVDNMIHGDYNWCRPLNLMTSVTDNADELNFIEDYLLNLNNNHPEVDQMWKGMGAAPLSLEQKESMSVKQDYQISDFDLMETRDYQISDFDLMETREEKDQSTFGAVY